jgi:DNA-binding transcriptional MerR regulator
MQIGEMAKKAGVSVQTVRFYEHRGLLSDPGRKASGYRIYSDRDLRRLLFIRQAKDLGFSLQEIRRILHLRDGGQWPNNVYGNEDYSVLRGPGFTNWDWRSRRISRCGRSLVISSSARSFMMPSTTSTSQTLGEGLP